MSERHLLESIARLVPPGSRVLDLGCGDGALLAHLQATRQCSGYGVEIDDAKVHACIRRGVNVLQLNLEDGLSMFGDDAFDVVLQIDTLQHLRNAETMLKPGGTIGVVDFYISRKHPPRGLARHRWITRAVWPLWFGIDNVFLSCDHLPFLQRCFDTISLHEGRSKVPYVPLGRVPFYVFLGRKRARQDFADDRLGSPRPGAAEMGQSGP